MAALCFYVAGLIMNDLYDLDDDQRERPGRPLPSGRVGFTQVVTVCSFLVLMGAVICYVLGAVTTWIGLALVAAIIGYNRHFKHKPVIGPACMGLCRGLSFMLGVSAAHPPAMASMSVVISFGFITFYIAAVTRIARTETHRRPGPMDACIPFTVVLIGGMSFLSLVMRYIDQGMAMMIIFAMTAFLTGTTAWSLSRRPGSTEAVPGHVGRLIGGIILIQSFLVLGSGATEASWGFGSILLALWPVNRLLSRWFYAS